MPATDRTIQILSYNLKNHVAYKELVGLEQRHHLELMCLQECTATALASKIGHLQLAAKTEAGKYGLAIYFNPVRLKFQKSTIYAIPLSWYERRFDPERRRLLVAEFLDVVTKRRLFVGCFHASQPTIANNALRRRQILFAMNTLKEVGKASPLILAGDYNYPLFKENLTRYMSNHNFTLFKSSKPTYNGRLYLDFAAVSNAKLTHTTTLDQGASDHAAIKAEIEL